MRILMLTQFYLPIIGGEEQHVRNLSAKLAARGHDVSVATIWHAGMPRFELDRGVRIYRIRSTMQRAGFMFKNKRRTSAPPFPDPEVTRGLIRVLKREQPQIVHAHNWMFYSFLPLKGWSKAKLVLSLHCQSLVCPRKKRIYRDTRCTEKPSGKCLACAGRYYGRVKGTMVFMAHKMMGFFERSAVDMLVPVNRSYAEDNLLTAHRRPFRVIPNFISDTVDVTAADRYPQLTAQLPLDDFILFVGAFARHKGVDTLIQAYGEITDAPPLVIIGYEILDDYPTRMSRLPQGVTVLMDWPHEAVMHAWQRCLFGVVPSLYSDPIPTVALEGMATGKALVASRVEGLPELVVDAETGFIVKPGDPVELEHAMELLIADPGLRTRMGAAARRKVADFRVDRVVPQMERLYTDLLGESEA